MWQVYDFNVIEPSWFEGDDAGPVLDGDGDGVDDEPADLGEAIGDGDGVGRLGIARGGLHGLIHSSIIHCLLLFTVLVTILPMRGH